MCDCTSVYDPAHPQFWHNCLPNEEKIENPKIQVFLKTMCEQKDSLRNKKLSGVKLML